MTACVSYLLHWLRHKIKVFIWCCLLGVPLRGLMHDLSKLLPDEFFPHAMYFFGDKLKRKSRQISLDRAWHLHQLRNRHHWSHWVTVDDVGRISAVKMPERFIREMIADWAARGTGKPMKWYLDKRDVMIMHPETKYRTYCLCVIATLASNKWKRRFSVLKAVLG